MVESEGTGPVSGGGTGTTMRQQKNDDPKSTAMPGQREKVRSTWPLYLICALVAGVVGALISWGFLTENLAALGLPDPGSITTVGMPFFRAVGWIFAALAVGSFLFSAFLISPRMPGNDNDNLRGAPLSVDGHLASRTGSAAAICFGLIAILMIPLVLSDVSGQPFSVAVQPAMWPTAIQQVATAAAWLWVAIIALLTGVAGLFTRKWITQPILLFGAVMMIVPLGLEGHSASGGSHDYGTNSFLWHLLFLVIWVGGLLALIAHGRRLGPDLDVALSRYSKLAMAAVIAMSISGLVNAAIRIEWSDWFTTSYGLIIVTKTVGVIALAFFGFIHRQLTIPKVRANPRDHRLFRQVAIVEVILMAAITGVAISMGRTPPPAPDDPNLSIMAIQLGFDLWQEPTFFNVWTMWRFDIMFGTIGLLLAAAYLWGLYKLRRKGGTWKLSRTIWFMLGCATLVLTMSSGIGMNMPATFSMHMVAHMILSMVIPVFWVLGAPLALVLAAVDPGEPGRPGLREWTLVAVKNPVLKIVMHPGVNTIQFLVIFYVLYLTPFYELMISEHAGHLAMNFVFLISGYLYFWEMIGPDPKPEERSILSKLGWLTFSMPFHLFFGVYLMQLTTILGEGFYARLDLPWDIDLLADQRVGGGIAWASGSFPLVIVYGVLFNNLRKEDNKKEKEIDDRADKDGNQDLDAYNAMLSQIHAKDAGQGSSRVTPAEELHQADVWRNSQQPGTGEKSGPSESDPDPYQKKDPDS